MIFEKKKSLFRGFSNYTQSNIIEEKIKQYVS